MANKSRVNLMLKYYSMILSLKLAVLISQSIIGSWTKIMNKVIWKLSSNILQVLYHFTLISLLTAILLSLSQIKCQAKYLQQYNLKIKLYSKSLNYIKRTSTNLTLYQTWGFSTFMDTKMKQELTKKLYYLETLHPKLTLTFHSSLIITKELHIISHIKFAAQQQTIL